MSYSPNYLSRYPDWMLDLANEFESPTLTRRKVFTLPSAKDAMRLRQQIYGFLRALRSEKALASYPNFQTVRLVIKGNDLHVLHVDEFLPKPQEKIE